MKRLLLIGSILMLFANSGSGALAAFVCPHSAAHSHAASDQRAACCRRQAVVKAESHCGAMESGEMASPAPDEHNAAATSESLNSCAHCFAEQTLPPPSIHPAAEQQKRLVKTTVSTAYESLTVHLSSLLPPLLAKPDPLPKIAVRQHLLLGVFLI